MSRSGGEEGNGNHHITQEARQNPNNNNFNYDYRNSLPPPPSSSHHHQSSYQSNNYEIPTFDSYRNGRPSLPNYSYNSSSSITSPPIHSPLTNFHRNSLQNTSSVSRPQPPLSSKSAPDWIQQSRMPSLQESRMNSINLEEQRNRNWISSSNDVGDDLNGVRIRSRTEWDYQSTSGSSILNGNGNSRSEEPAGSWSWTANSTPLPPLLPWLPPPIPSTHNNQQTILKSKEDQQNYIVPPIEITIEQPTVEISEQPIKKSRKPRRKAGDPPRDTAQRRYHCELCVLEPRSFARPSALKIHMLTHTKEKPHVCQVCSRAFAIASNLKRHAKLHENAEEETFSEVNNLDRWQAPNPIRLTNSQSSQLQPWNSTSISNNNGNNGNGNENDASLESNGGHQFDNPY